MYNNDSNVEDDPNPGETISVLKFFSVFCCLSIFFQSIIVVLYIKFVDLRSRKGFTSRLILLMALTDIVVWTISFQSNMLKLSKGNTMNFYSQELCRFEGIVWNTFLLSNFLLTVVFSLSMLIEIKYDFMMAKYEKWILPGIFIYSIFFSVVPIFHKMESYGEDDHFKCWITEYYMIYRIIGFYAHLWIAFLINLGIVVYIVWLIKDVHFSQNTLIKKMIWIPLIMLFCWTEPSIRRIKSDDSNYELKFLQYIFMPMQGFLNAFVYGFINDNVKKKVFFIFTVFKKKSEEEREKVHSNLL